jgi:hypothetical protein
MSRSQDLLGKIIDTSMVPDDDAPQFDDRGYTDVYVPEDSTSTDTEEDEVYKALLEDLSPEEAQENVEFMRPLNTEEKEILKRNPELKNLTKIDDAEHEDWLIQKSREGYQAIDHALEDNIYGDPTMNEELMERNDSDSGFSLKRAFKKVGRAVKKVGRQPFRGIKAAGKGAWKGTKKVGRTLASIKKFVPGRDRKKAQVVKNLYNKLWFEHANWLGQQDRAAGRTLKPRTQYEQESKAWAKQEILKQKLPLKFAVSGSDVLGSDILGADIMGVWWNPFSWFATQANIVINNTTGQRSDAPPDGEDAMTPQNMQIPEDGEAYPEESYPEEIPDESYSEGDNMQGWNDFLKLEGESDSLGAFASQILGKTPDTSDKIIDSIVKAMKTGEPLSPGEVAMLATLAKQGNPKAKQVYGLLFQKGKAVNVAGDDESGLDPWTHKLNPLYWLKSSQQKSFIDTERKMWKEHAATQKKLGKQKEVLESAEAAQRAAQSAHLAQQQTLATDAQLKAIAQSLNISGSFVGHEKQTPVSNVVLNALEKIGKKETASKLYGKIKSGEKLSKDELKEVRKIARLVGRMKVVHGDFVGANEILGTFIGAFVGNNIQTALKRNKLHGRIATALVNRAKTRPLRPKETKLLGALRKSQNKLHKFTTSHVSGGAFVGHPDHKALCKGAFVGATKVMSPADKKMLLTITKLAKAGNPRAQKALNALKKTGEIMGGDFVGLSLSKAFKYATAPITYPLKKLGQAAKWTGKKLGIVKTAPTAQQARLNRIAAARKRRLAAQAKARAKDAESQAEVRAQEAIAAAAEAEADAADAEATAQEMAMKTAEVEADPDSFGPNEDDDAGSFVGNWDAMVGKTITAKEAQLLKKAGEKTPTGKKIRGGAKVAKKVMKKDAAAIKAVKNIKSSAAKGNKQAQVDLNAIKAGRAALKAQKKVQRKAVRVAARKARKAKVVAVQKRFEAAVANKLVRAERKNNFRKFAKVQRKAAAGNPKARAYVAKQVAAAKKGDKKAKTRVELLTLGKKVNDHSKTSREKKNMRQAERFLASLKKGNPTARRQYEVVKAAAAKGNPNAKRMLVRLTIASAVVGTITTGVVRQPGAKKTPKNSTIASKAKVKSAKKKVASGTGTREELTAGAKAAKEIGDVKTAAVLAQAASHAPSATETIKQGGLKIAAAEQGSVEAKKEMTADLNAAKTGDVKAIQKTGAVIAAQTISDMEKGKPISPVMKEAVNMVERANAGDPVAIETLKNVSEAATQSNPIPEATLAAVTATAAATTLKALESKPKAKAEFQAKVNAMPKEERTAAEAEVATLVAKANDGTITPEEGVKGASLAARIGKPKIAAEISAKAPPLDLPVGVQMSSLPDAPLPPITGIKELLKESLRALAFATRDPMANYREGVGARSKYTVSNSGIGWSPFSFFSKLKKILPFTPFAAAAPFVPDAKKSAIATTTAPAVVTETKASGECVEKAPKHKPNPHVESKKQENPFNASEPKPNPYTGDDTKDEKPTSGFKGIITQALKDKQINKRELNKAVKANVGPNAPGFAVKASGDQIVKFLTAKGVKIV